MAAPRSVQFIALRNLSRGSHQVRNLHMTGPATFPSRILTKERPGLNLPHDIASLRNECKKRKIDFSGNKQDVSFTISPSPSKETTTNESPAHLPPLRRRDHKFPRLQHRRRAVQTPDRH
jgi:hypothetical protein